AEAEGERERPTVIIADTIKGWRLPFAGDPLNHGMLLTAAQLEALRQALGVPADDPLARFGAGSREGRHIAALPPLFRAPRPTGRARPEPPPTLDSTYTGAMSTQEAFGRVLGALARLPVAERIVTVSADVAVTTHLAGWINRRGVYFPEKRPDYFGDRGIPQAVQWRQSPGGQHLELGIAEHNLFLLLAALGLADDLAGEPLLALGTLYDPFVARGLDALLHALYAGARFVVAATPSGVSLSPEGGAHQSVVTPSLGIALPHCTYYEPTFARDTEWILLEGLRRIADGTGESLYLRLSTRPIEQALRGGAVERREVLEGGYRLVDRARPWAIDAEPIAPATRARAARRRVERRAVRAPAELRDLSAAARPVVPLRVGELPRLALVAPVLPVEPLGRLEVGDGVHGGAPRVELLAHAEVGGGERVLGGRPGEPPPELGGREREGARRAPPDPVAKAGEVRLHVALRVRLPAVIHERDLAPPDEAAALVDPDARGHVHQAVEGGHPVGAVDQRGVLGPSGADPLPRRLGAPAVLRDRDDDEVQLPELGVEGLPARQVEAAPSQIGRAHV